MIEYTVPWDRGVGFGSNYAVDCQVLGTIYFKVETVCKDLGQWDCDFLYQTVLAAFTLMLGGNWIQPFVILLLILYKFNELTAALCAGKLILHGEKKYNLNITMILHVHPWYIRRMLIYCKIPC